MKDTNFQGLPEWLERFTTTTDWRYGKITYLTNDVFIGRALGLYGEWAQKEIEFLVKLLADLRDPVIIDVGANIGTHTIALATSLGPSSTVVAFEPQSAVYSILRKNVEDADVDNVQIEQCAAGAADATTTIPMMDFESVGNFGGVAVDAVASAVAVETVRVIPLDSFNLTSCHLLKIDAEGMEPAVIEGAKSIICSFKPLIHAECSNISTGWAVIETVSRYLPNGYTVYVHSASAYNHNNFKRCEENIFGDMVETSLVFIPEGSSLLNVISEEMVPIKSIRDLEQALLGKRYVKIDDFQIVKSELDWSRNKILAQEQEIEALRLYADGKLNELEIAHANLRTKTMELESVQEDAKVLERRLGETLQELASVREKAERMVKDTQTLNERIEQLEDAYEEALLTKQAIERQYESILTSHSWRLTEPLRKIKRGLGRK